MTKLNNDEYEYLGLEKYVLEHGKQKDDRTGTGTISIFGYQMRFDLSKGFPLLTTKSVPLRLIKSELLWFLHGDTNIRYLLQHNNHIWDEWAFKNWVNSDEYNGPDMTDFALRADNDKEFEKQYLEQKNIFCEKMLNDEKFALKYGELGDVYGAQWRRWKGENGRVIDQIAKVIHDIKTNPDSRRLIVTAWNPSSVDKVALPPCPTLFQFYVRDGKLSCQLYQRSADIFLGVPFDIASYSLLTSLIARECNLEVGEFILSLGDAHIYNNLIEQVKEQVTREPYKLPKLWLNPDKKKVADFDMDDIKVLDYKHHSRIKGNVSV